MLQQLFLLCSHGASSLDLKQVKALRLPYALVISMITTAESAALLALLQSSASPDAKVAGVRNMKSIVKKNGTTEAALPSLREVVSIAMASDNASLSTAGSYLNALLGQTRPPRPAATSSTRGTNQTPVEAPVPGPSRTNARSRATLKGKAPVRYNARANTIETQHATVAGPSNTTARSEKIDQTAGAQESNDMANIMETQNEAQTQHEAVEPVDGPSETVATPESLPAEIVDQPNPTQTLNASEEQVMAGPSDVFAYATTANPSPESTEEPVVAGPSSAILSIPEPVLPPYDMDPNIEVQYVGTQRDLERIFQEMHPHFEDKESEANWMHRERSVLRLRRLIRGNALLDFRQSFLTGIRGLLDGITKVVTSLRTTLSTTGCLLVQELTVTAGHGIDPMVEILLQTLIKLSAATKKIAAHNANVTVDLICANASYSLRILQHIWITCQEKNVQPRSYAAGWLKTFIITHGRDRAHLEHSGGLEYVDKIIRRGLADANPGVRGNMRGTFWVFSIFFAERAEGIMASLDANSKRLLENDPTNPRAGNSSENALSQETDNGTTADPFTSNPTASSTRPSLKEAIAARKREAAAAKGKGKAKAIAPRPESTEPPMSFPTMRDDSGPSTVTAGLASAPLRPMRAPKRPELIRPATAEPMRRFLVSKPTSTRLERAVSSLQVGQKTGHEPTPSTSYSQAPVGESSYEHTQLPIDRPDNETDPGVETPNLHLQELGVGNHVELSEPSIQGSYAQSSANLAHPNIQPPTSARLVSALSNPGVETPNLHLQELGIGNHVELPEPSTQGSYAQSSANLAHPTIQPPTSARPVSALSNPGVESTNLNQGLSTENQAEPSNLSLQGPCAPSSANMAHSNIQPPTSSRPVSAVSNPGDESPNLHQGLRTENQAEPSNQSLQGPYASSSANLAHSNTQSPMPSHSESVSATSPKVERHRSPLQVYEDNFEPSGQRTSPEDSAQPTTVLGELPNEQVIAPARSMTSAPLVKTLGSPEKMTMHKVESTRLLIHQGISQLRSMSLDRSGLFRLQQLLSDSEIVPDDIKFHDFFCGLIDYLNAPKDRLSHLANPNRALEVKVQVLVLFKFGLKQPAEHFMPHLPKGVCAIAQARDEPDAKFNFVTHLEETADQMYRWAWGNECIEALLTWMERGDHGKWGHDMALKVLAGILAARAHHGPLREDDVRRVGCLGVRYLTHEDTDLRKGVVACCLGLYRVMGPDTPYWQLLEAAGEEKCRVVAYYMAKAARS